MPAVDEKGIRQVIDTVSSNKRERHQQQPYFAHWGHTGSSNGSVVGGSGGSGGRNTTNTNSRTAAAADSRTESSSAYTTVIGPPPCTIPNYPTSTIGQSSATPSSYCSTTGFGTAAASSASTYTTDSSQQQQFQPMAATLAPVPAGVLACEFRDLLGCAETFDASTQTDAWIRHICHFHLRDRFPSKSLCWFCDDNSPFDVAAYKNCDSSSQRHRQALFEARLRHVRDHIRGGYYGYEDMRPDFSLVKHLWRRGLVSQDGYENYTSYSELPQCYKLEGVRPLDWEPEEMRRERERKGRKVHDQEKEDRARRREERREERKMRRG